MKILFRASLAEENELSIAKNYFDVIESRADIKANDTILCRYSSLPYHNELETDVNKLGGSLVNSFKDHRYVADISQWYNDLQDYTPKTWFGLEEFINLAPEGEYIVKGETNSKKQLWATHMFAEDKNQARDIYFKLMDDGVIGHQSIVFREFEQFINYGQSISGAPITKEFRIFILDGKIVGEGFYWSIFPDIIDGPQQKLDPEAYDLIGKVSEIISPNIRFFVVDIAQRKDGVWRVVELNDGCMSGLSCVDPDSLYKNINDCVLNERI